MKHALSLFLLLLVGFVALPLFGETSRSYKDPMLNAVLKGDVVYIKAHKADIDKPYAELHGGSALFVVRDGEVPTVSITTLLGLGAKVDFEDGTKSTPLFWAVYAFQTDIVNILLAAGADVNHKNEFSMTALASCASTQNSFFAKILLDAGADPSIADKLGRTAMDHSKEENDDPAAAKEFQDLLKKYGPHGNGKPPVKPAATPKPTTVPKATATPVARQDPASTPKPPALPVSEQLATAVNDSDFAFLAKFTGDLNQSLDEYADSALMLACNNGNIEMATALLDAGARINQKNKLGFTALICAVYNSYVDLTDYLIARGADVNVKITQGQTVLMMAVNQGIPSVTQILINAGAAVNVQDPNGFTALMFAVAKGQPDQVESLLNAGARADLAAADGTTAKDYTTDDLILRALSGGAE